MSSSNCCFLTCIQVSQEAGQVVWYSYLFQNFPQFIVIHRVKGFDIVSKAEIDVFLELSGFFDDPVMLAIRSLVPLPSLNPAWTSHSSVLFILHLVVCTSWCPSPSCPPPSLPTGNHFIVLRICESVPVLLCSCVYFLDSTYKWKLIVFVFLYLTYFTDHNTLQVHLCCCKRQNFILFYDGVIFVCLCASVYHVFLVHSSVDGHRLVT